MTMTLIPYKTFKIETDLTEQEIRDRLKNHEEFSKTKNFFNATTDDFLLETKAKGKEVLIKRKYPGRRTLPSKIIMTLSRDTKTMVKLRIVPRSIGFILQLPVLLLIIFIPSPVILKASFFGLMYLIGMIGFAFDIWWTRDFFEKKLLTDRRNKEGE
jgi:hypothetical protein